MKFNRSQRLTVLTGLLVVVLAASVQAALASGSAATEKPDWFYSDIVDAAFVKQHVTVPMAENVMIIDSRPFRAKYVKGHIPMAVSIPDTSFDKYIEQLPKEKNALLIFYCGGPT